MEQYGSDDARDYVAIYTPKTEIDPARACLVVVDIQYATGNPETGLGALLNRQGRLHEAEYRYQRIAEKVFLLTPRNVEVSAEDRQRLVEQGFFNPA